MRHCDPAFLRSVLELLMAADLIDFVPAVFFQFLDTSRLFTADLSSL